MAFHLSISVCIEKRTIITFQVRFSLLSSNFHEVFSQLLKFHTKKKIQFIHNWTRTTHFYVMNCLFSRTSILSVEMIKNLTFRYFNISISSIGIKSLAKIYFEGLRSINPSIHPHPYWTGKKYWDCDANDCRPRVILDYQTIQWQNIVCQWIINLFFLFWQNNDDALTKASARINHLQLLKRAMCTSSCKSESIKLIWSFSWTNNA